MASGAIISAPWQIGPFVRPADGEPVIQPDRGAAFTDPIMQKVVHWEYSHAFNPAAIAWNNKLYVLFRAEGQHGDEIGGYTSRVGLAESADGRSFKVLPHPVLYPAPGRWKKDEWPGGCEDPRVVQSQDGTFVLTFTMWNRKVARLGVATSKNLTHWTHHGPVFREAYRGRFANLWGKSGAIVTRKAGQQIIAAKIHGRYWMYWHTDRQILLAHSEDLLNWVPVLDNHGKPQLVLPKNKAGHFDSSLTEPGPPALLTENGIVLFYNGMSDGHMTGSLKIPARQYSAGQALFDADNPAKLLHRPARPFFWPEEPWEKTGQYKAGTTFVEGLAWFNDRWFLFYGGADTVVGMAVA
jgi:predicted GH43/DUF377 family glycosyl hydrolase